ncbi:hypothetical protein CDIK_2862 [Cucumispora dikerogammari]|nr:hypothetical protein CDIK_2862 [Cucumispora dikerogammari]
MRQFKLTNSFIQAVIAYKRTGALDTLFSSVEEKKNFKKVCNKFRICLINPLELEYIKTLTLFLKVYSKKRIEDKLNFIELVHSLSNHPERHRLTYLLRDKLYNYTRGEIEAVKRGCPQCASKLFLILDPLFYLLKLFLSKKDI